MAVGLAGWNLARPGPLPPHSVLVYERAANRVQTWRRTAGVSATSEPPLDLLRALIHTDKVPTALASHSDHYWLPGLERVCSKTGRA